MELLEWYHIDGLVQDCGIYIAHVLEIPQSCTKPSISLRQVTAAQRSDTSSLYAPVGCGFFDKDGRVPA